MSDTPAKYIKREGLKSLSQVCEIVDQSPQTLSNWFYHKPELFKVVILGCKVAIDETNY